MSERKVLNKYYPPDFDPSKIPRMKLPKNRQYTVRLMAPFNMRCATCGEYIYRGKKFNARKEDVEGQDYCGIRIYRFYIKCTRCLQEISFKTDPQNTDYEIEAGAIRNFMALKRAQEQEKREEEEAKEEEANNPMKLLENRTEQSRLEIEEMEKLEEIKDQSRRVIDLNELLKKYDTAEAREKKRKQEEEEDNNLAKRLFAKKQRTEEDTDFDGDGLNIEEEEEEIIEEEDLIDKDEIKSISSISSFSNFSYQSPLEKLKALKANKSNSNAVPKAPVPVTTPAAAPAPPQNKLLSLCSYSDSDESE
ncbi:splicing factor YJU2 [Planococcus citri]|uniref:splicing factor YJU2 n=1 Tax=Planococcus citri TaxID=170843 RepID=UPI0031F79058